MNCIKYRAWDYVNKIMLYPYSKKHRTNNTLDGFTFDDKGKPNVFCQNSGGDPVWFTDFEQYDKPLPLMQYTGHPDMKDKEIYVGDIWSNGRSKYIIKSLKYFYWLMFNDLMRVEFDKGEIIGNIYENPEIVDGLK